MSDGESLQCVCANYMRKSESMIQQLRLTENAQFKLISKFDVNNQSIKHIHIGFTIIYSFNSTLNSALLTILALSHSTKTCRMSLLTKSLNIAFNELCKTAQNRAEKSENLDGRNFLNTLMRKKKYERLLLKSFLYSIVPDELRKTTSFYTCTP